MSCVTIAIGIQKGGCGKTTTTHSLGASLVRNHAKRVLLIDLEPTGNLTLTCGLSVFRNHDCSACEVVSVDGTTLAHSTTYELLTGTTNPLNLCVATSTPGLSLVPSDPLLSAADQILVGVGKEYRLRSRIELLKPYFDFILIDTPPSFGVLTINALTAADYCLVPLDMGWFSLQGIGLLHQTLQDIRSFTNPNLVNLGFLCNRFNQNSLLTKQVLTQLPAFCEAMQTKILSTKIRKCDAIGKAQSAQQDIFAFAPRSNASADFLSLSSEVLKECSHVI